MKRMSGVKCSLVIIVVSLLCLLLAYFFTNETTAELLSCLKVIVLKFKSEALILLTIAIIIGVLLFLTGYFFGAKTETKAKKDESTQKKQTSHASHASKTNQPKNNSTGRPF